MSEWRRRVMQSRWSVQRLPKNAPMEIECRYGIYAAVWAKDGVSYGEESLELIAVVDMDCAGEGWGEEEANHICNLHNRSMDDSRDGSVG